MNFQIRATYDGRATDYIYSIKLEILRGSVRFKVDAPFFDDPLPPPLLGFAEGKRYPGLYKYEVVEIFIAAGARGDPAHTSYLELELGPGGDYYAIAFGGEQKWDSQDDELLLDEDPEVEIDRKAMRWSCKGSIPFFLLPDPAIDPTDPLNLWWHINCTAIHGDSRERQYLSQNVLPGPAPNFHQLSSFSSFSLSDLDSQRLQSLSVSNRSYTVPLALRLPSVESESCARMKAPSLPTETIDETLERIRLRNASVVTENQASKVRPHLLPEEAILMCCTLRKRKGWSHRQRLLVLTSKPRLIYYSVSSPPYILKGAIEWGMQLPLSVRRVSKTALDLALQDGSRTYHWFDDQEPPGDSLDRLAESIEDIQKAWEGYMRSNFGYANSPPPASSPAPAPAPTLCLIL